MPRSPILWATIAAMTAIPSLSLAADFQEARHKFCIRSSACTLNFAGPGTGQRLRIDHIIPSVQVADLFVISLIC